MLKNIFALSFLLLATTFGTTAAIAAPPAPNLEVMTWQGNATPLVESPYQYTTRVKNVGNQTAQGVIMTVEFPLTNTSPTRHILGKLTGIQASGGTCSVVSNKIVCNFGSLSNNQIKYVRFNFEFQVATTAPTLKSSVTTTSTNEVNAANNTRSFTPTITYPINELTAGSYIVSSCTGTGLTSFYECELFPSSIQTVLGLDFNLGGTLSVTDYPQYTGFWDQAVLPNRSLHFTVTGELEFSGYASTTNCYKGITTFPTPSAYNSAYRVCRQ